MTSQVTSILSLCSWYTRLDHTEPTGSEYDQSLMANGVLFRGALRIDRLSWLTHKARMWIEHDLRQRDIQSRINNGPQSLRALSTLSLHFVYEQVHDKIKILIQGKKNLTAAYFTCELRTEDICSIY